MTVVYILAGLLILMALLVIGAGIYGWWLYRKELRKGGADDEIIEAQHDETGRMWRGPRYLLPRRYHEVNLPRSLMDEAKAEYPEGWRSVTQPERKG